MCTNKLYVQTQWIPYQRHIFRSMKQENSETVDKYVARLIDT